MSDEIVDLVDTLDVIVGTAPRAALRDLEAGFRVVHVLAMDAFGDLIVQRIAGSRQSPFTHGSSVAGHVKSGESYALAAMREFKEELGAAPVAIASAGTTWLDEGPRRKFIGVFVARAPHSLFPDPSEVASLEVLPVGAVRNLIRTTTGTFSPTFIRVFRHIDNSDGWKLV